MYVAVALLAALLLGNIATQIAAHRDEKSQPEIQVVVHRHPQISHETLDHHPHHRCHRGSH